MESNPQKLNKTRNSSWKGALRWEGENLQFIHVKKEIASKISKKKNGNNNKIRNNRIKTGKENLCPQRTHFLVVGGEGGGKKQTYYTTSGTDKCRKENKAR